MARPPLGPPPCDAAGPPKGGGAPRVPAGLGPRHPPDPGAEGDSLPLGGSGRLRFRPRLWLRLIIDDNAIINNLIVIHI